MLREPAFVKACIAFDKYFTTPGWYYREVLRQLNKIYLTFGQYAEVAALLCCCLTKQCKCPIVPCAIRLLSENLNAKLHKEWRFTIDVSTGKIKVESKTDDKTTLYLYKLMSGHVEE